MANMAREGSSIRRDIRTFEIRKDKDADIRSWLEELPIHVGLSDYIRKLIRRDMRGQFTASEPITQRPVIELDGPVEIKEVQASVSDLENNLLRTVKGF